MESGYPQRLGSVVKDQRIPVARSCLYPPGNKLRHQRDARAKRSTINNKGRLLRHFSAAAELRIRWELTASVSFLVAIVHCHIPLLLRNVGRIFNTDINVENSDFLKEKDDKANRRKKRKRDLWRRNGPK
ncbi:hypothetical protein CEXT_785701 [Caerostris extrusa]|uniref:Uncharacterized protein n=1 Tax=Caerostris extrusa TaxID=172846 RepID=A0AAV4MKQ1_CAEEX|nr:hypothetical protein CEXT_785701 [Caerostris extrusa]